MLNHEWIDELYCRAKTDAWYQSWAQAVRESEPAFRAIRDSLPEVQQEQLDDYIATAKPRRTRCF